jgi:hypothetical protein
MGVLHSSRLYRWSERHHLDVCWYSLNPVRQSLTGHEVGHKNYVATIMKSVLSWLLALIYWLGQFKPGCLSLSGSKLMRRDIIRVLLLFHLSLLPLWSRHLLSEPFMRRKRAKDSEFHFRDTEV